MHISFHGAVDTVTGSRHLVETGGTRLMLDCGMFQGYKVLRERNWAPPPPALREADAVVLSHAHLDHSGWLPALVAHGWRGPIYASPATIELARVLLLDAAHLQEEDARRANRYGYSRHAKALPLYTKRDAERALALMKPLQRRMFALAAAIEAASDLVHRGNDGGADGVHHVVGVALQ